VDNRFINKAVKRVAFLLKHANLRNLRSTIREGYSTAFLADVDNLLAEPMGNNLQTQTTPIADQPPLASGNNPANDMQVDELVPDSQPPSAETTTTPANPNTWDNAISTTESGQRVDLNG
jgi:hypothetical protein